MRKLRNILRAYVRNRFTHSRVRDYDASRELNGGVHYWDFHGFDRDYNFAYKMERREVKLLDVLQAHKDITVLGNGAFSTVVEVEGQVYKIVRRVDHSYEAFVDFCLSYGPSKYLPRVEKPFSIRGFTVYTMEKLIPLVRNIEYNSIESVYSFLCRNINYSPSIYDPELVNVLRAMVLHRNAYNALYKSRELHTDMHSGNFMSRGDQIVITDPWS